jgi:hypothetical protein
MTLFARCAQEKPQKAGRKPDPVSQKMFADLFNHIEESGRCQFTFPELIEIATKLSPNNVLPVSTKYIKVKASQYFGDKAIFTEREGRPTVVTLIDRFVMTSF